MSRSLYVQNALPDPDQLTWFACLGLSCGRYFRLISAVYWPWRSFPLKREERRSSHVSKNSPNDLVLGIINLFIILCSKNTCNPVKGSEFILGFLCNCFSCFITASIAFTCILYPQCIHMIYIIYTKSSQY